MPNTKSYIQDDVIIRGSGADRFIRFIESLGQYNGAFIQFEGSTNKFHIGVHDAADDDPLSDQKVVTIQRADGFVGINTETPNFELDLEGTFRNEGVRISPTFTDFTNRVALVNPSFGSARLGDSDLQTPSLDIGQVINFIDSGIPQQVNWSIFENNNVMTIRSSGGNFVGVLDLNGANQADYAVDDAEATMAQTINYTNGFGYVNDQGVQRYLPGVAVVAQSFFHVMINSGGAPRLKHIMTYYDGTTYDVIREIETDGRMVHKKTVEFELPTKGVDAVDPEDFVTKAQLDAASGGGGISETSGTFLPSLVDSGGGATYTVNPANNDSSWVRQGNLVHVQIRMAGITQAGVNSGLLQITGLPFASAPSTFSVFKGIVSDRNAVPAGVLVSDTGIMAGNQTSFELYTQGGVDAIFGNWGSFNAANNGFLILSGTYQV